MTYKEFIERVINEGIEAAKVDYIKPEDQERLEGSIAGFEACRNKYPFQLVDVLNEANEEMNQAYTERKKNYWWFRCFQAEVEWVCNVVSAMLINNQQASITSYLPTARGFMKAAEIIGIREIEF